MEEKMTGKRYKCNQCELKFATTQELVEHYLKEHPDSREASKIRFGKLRKGKIVQRVRTDKERVKDRKTRFG